MNFVAGLLMLVCQNGDFRQTPRLEKEDVYREECANKGSAYMNSWMYVVHELEDALSDCAKGNVADNDMGVHAWDEGWAFYAGSLEGTDGSGKGALVYALAEKRCQNFGTCLQGSSGTA